MDCELRVSKKVPGIDLMLLGVLKGCVRDRLRAGGKQCICAKGALPRQL